MKHSRLLLAAALGSVMLLGCEREADEVPAETEQRPLTTGPTPAEPMPPSQTAETLPAQPTAEQGDTRLSQPQASAAEGVHAATGVVVELDPEAALVTVAHDPVESLGWPSMTMNFAVEDPEQLRELDTGERVHFTFIDAGNNRYVIRVIEPAA